MEASMKVAVIIYMFRKNVYQLKKTNTDLNKKKKERKESSSDIAWSC